MPLRQIRKLNSECLLGLWEVTESHNELRAILKRAGREDLLPIPAFKNDRRNLEWMAARCLALEMISQQADIGYLESGKPVLLNYQGYISLTHSWPYIGILYNKDFDVGIDIERIDNRILKIVSKFVNEEELQWLKDPPDLNELYLIWGAKESVFKCVGGGGIDFRKHLTTYPPHKASQLTSVNFRKGHHNKSFNIYYEYLDSMILVYTIANNGQ